MLNGTHNDYFGRKKSVFGKYYIDYCLKEITNSHKINEEELKIIKIAQIKYYTLIGLNFLIFLYTSKRIYKKGILELYLGEWVFNIRDGFIFSIGFSLGAMILIYRESQRTYYNDVKYIIKKYKFVNSKQYADAAINSKIAEMYKDKLEEIERG